MAKRIIKPDSGNTLVLQEDNGSIDALTVETNGNVTLGGNVGIGTSSPDDLIHCASSGQAGLRLECSSGREYGIFTDATSKFRFYDWTASADRLIIDSSGNLQFNSGFGSVGTAYGCRAWVQFNNSGTRTGHGNVSSVTDEAATGVYTINFTTAMPDDNYAFAGMVANTTDNWSSDSTGATRGPIGIFQNGTSQPSTGSCRVQSRYGSTGSADGSDIEFSQYTVVFFR